MAFATCLCFAICHYHVSAFLDHPHLLSLALQSDHPQSESLNSEVPMLESGSEVSPNVPCAETWVFCTQGDWKGMDPFRSEAY